MPKDKGYHPVRTKRQDNDICTYSAFRSDHQLSISTCHVKHSAMQYTAKILSSTINRYLLPAHSCPSPHPSCSAVCSNVNPCSVPSYLSLAGATILRQPCTDQKMQLHHALVVQTPVSLHYTLHGLHLIMVVLQHHCGHSRCASLTCNVCASIVCNKILG